MLSPTHSSRQQQQTLGQRSCYQHSAMQSSCSVNHDLIVGFSGCTDAAAVDDNVAFELDKHLLLDIPLGRGNSRHTSIFITTKSTGDEIRVMLIE